MSQCNHSMGASLRRRCDPDGETTLAHGLNKSLLFQDAKRVKELKAEGITIFPDRQVLTN